MGISNLNVTTLSSSELDGVGWPLDIPLFLDTHTGNSLNSFLGFFKNIRYLRRHCKHIQICNFCLYNITRNKPNIIFFLKLYFGLDL